MRKISFKEYLKDISENSNSEIEKFLAKEALGEDSPFEFILGICQHGCVTGWVSSLVWFNQTHKFFDSFYEEVNELVLSFQESLGASLMIDGDLKNFLCWFSVEYKAREIIDNYELI